MKWRTFWQNAASLFRPAPRTKSADGLSEKYRDSMALVARLLREGRVSRRSMERRGMSQSRYNAACELLAQLHLVTVQPGKAPQLAWGVNDLDGVDKALSEWIDEQRRLARSSRRFTSPLSLFAFFMPRS